MKVVTYLGFTVLSIFIQFCVMDYIQEKIQLPVQNVTSQKETLSDILKNISSKPHALYYRTHSATKSLLSKSPKIYSNSSMPAVPLGLGITDASTTTIFDVLYEENTTDTEVTSTTEIYFTSTEYDNITEITFFDTKNKSLNVPSTTPKNRISNHCECNLLVSGLTVS